MSEGSVVLEHHTVDFFPERWFDLVLVLRCDNTILFDRLVNRYDWILLFMSLAGIPPTRSRRTWSARLCSPFWTRRARATT